MPGVNVCLYEDNTLKVESQCCKAEVVKGDPDGTNQVVLSCSGCHTSLLVFDTEERMKKQFSEAVDHLKWEQSRRQSPKTGS